VVATKWEYGRWKFYGRLVAFVAVILLLIGIAVAAARQTKYEPSADRMVPVDSPASFAGLGIYIVASAIILFLVGFVAYIHFDLKLKTAPPSKLMSGPPPQPTPGKLCAQCGKVIPSHATVCRYCGGHQS